MRLVRKRITVRGVMLAVALMAGALSWGVRLFRSSLEPLTESFRRRSASHARIAEEWNRNAESGLLFAVPAAGTTPGPLSPEVHVFPHTRVSGVVRVPENVGLSAGPWVDGYRPLQKEEMRELGAYHAAMSQKYERAASYPWRSVDPDPPPPTW
jgi:hypothetical protein